MHFNVGQKLVDQILALNKERSAEFSSPDAVLSRRKSQIENPSAKAAFKCADGRVNMARITGTPPGIIQPFRNIGGKFDLGWPYLGTLVREWVEYSISRGRNCLVLTTYHHSKGDKRRGCRGYEYDADAARSGADKLRKQFEHVFGRGHSVVYPILVGIETDEDALTFHGSNGHFFEVAKESKGKRDDETDYIYRCLCTLYPDMNVSVRRDLLPLVVGNMAYVRRVRTQNRTFNDVEHREQYLGIGRGFEWLHVYNIVLLVGPYSFDVADPIAKAAGILLDNIMMGRIPRDDGVVLMSSAVFRDPIGPEPLLASEKALSLARLGVQTIESKVPDLMPHLSLLVGTMDVNTRLFTPIQVQLKDCLTG